MRSTQPPTPEETSRRTDAVERQERRDQARLIMRTAAGLVAKKVGTAQRQFQQAVEERRAADEDQAWR